MDWMEVPLSNQRSSCTDPDKLIRILQEKGYAPRDAGSLAILPQKCLKGGISTVLWVHHDAVKLWDEDRVAKCLFPEL